ncbi:hypothetical protein [Aeromicrobium massiliense]|uniref:hypothetical protein n=1 Tax=Aeromicrobium massiliense TaxID=1464554 RepID=UPI000AC56FF7|nr:hypothetical protein [Aeromicrobium massiliense]
MTASGRPWVKHAVLMQDGRAVGAIRYVYRWATVRSRRWFRRRDETTLVLSVAVIERDAEGVRVPEEFWEPHIRWVDEAELVSDSSWERALRTGQFDSMLEPGLVLEVRPVPADEAAILAPWFDGFDWDVLPEGPGSR